jgi:hypothetical protein
MLESGPWRRGRNDTGELSKVTRATRRLICVVKTSATWLSRLGTYLDVSHSLLQATRKQLQRSTLDAKIGCIVQMWAKLAKILSDSNDS